MHWCLLMGSLPAKTFGTVCREAGGRCARGLQPGMLGTGPQAHGVPYPPPPLGYLDSSCPCSHPSPTTAPPPKLAVSHSELATSPSTSVFCSARSVNMC